MIDSYKVTWTVTHTAIFDAADADDARGAFREALAAGELHEPPTESETIHVPAWVAPEKVRIVRTERLDARDYRAAAER